VPTKRTKLQREKQQSCKEIGTLLRELHIGPGFVLPEPAALDCQLEPALYERFAVDDTAEELAEVRSAKHEVSRALADDNLTGQISITDSGTLEIHGTRIRRPGDCSHDASAHH
jgi:hypothetical protein